MDTALSVSLKWKRNGDSHSRHHFGRFRTKQNLIFFVPCLSLYDIPGTPVASFLTTSTASSSTTAIAWPRSPLSPSSMLCYVRLNSAGGEKHSIAARNGEGADSSPAWRRGFDRNKTMCNNMLQNGCKWKTGENKYHYVKLLRHQHMAIAVVPVGMRMKSWGYFAIGSGSLNPFLDL